MVALTITEVAISFYLFSLCPRCIVVLHVCREVLDEVLDTSELDRIETRLQDQALGMAERVRKLVEETARVRKDQTAYQREFDALTNEYNRVNTRIRAMEDRNRDKEKCRRKLEIFLGLLEKVEVCKAFKPYTFVTLVEKVVVGRDGRLEFYFRSGMLVEYLLKG